MHHSDLSLSRSNNIEMKVRVIIRTPRLYSWENRGTPATEAWFNRVQHWRARIAVGTKRLVSSRQAQNAYVHVPRLAISNLIYSRPPCVLRAGALGESGRERETARESNETTREAKGETKTNAKRVDKRRYVPGIKYT